MALFNKLGHVLKPDFNKDGKKNNKSAYDEPTLVERFQRRRDITTLGRRVHYSQSYITQVIQAAIRSCPLVYDVQATRAVILFGNAHQDFWDLVKDVQRQYLPERIFNSAALKIAQCEEGLGTVLFYEDHSVIKTLQKNVPLMADHFPIWSEQVTGMAQFAVWTALADIGLGATLQHYPASIDQGVTELFNLDSHWRLKSQLVFGSIEGQVEDHVAIQIEQQFKVFN